MTDNYRQATDGEAAMPPICAPPRGALFLPQDKMENPYCPQAPVGADWVGEFDDLDTRVVFSARFDDGQFSAKAACCQARSGDILDDPAEEAPSVILGDESSIRLTSTQARYMARDLLSAAAMADDWALNAAIARGGAKLRHPAGKAVLHGLDRI